MDDPLRDVLTFRRFPAGITGIPRLREWDGFAVVELPELTGEQAEFELLVPTEGPVSIHAPFPVPESAAERITNELDAQLDRPYEAHAVRQDAGHFAVGARALRAGDPIELPGDISAVEIQVVRAPDGELVTTVDGEPVDPSMEELYEPAFALLERHGEARFESFVARADKADGGRWNLTVDPL